LDEREQLNQPLRIDPAGTEVFLKLLDCVHARFLARAARHGKTSVAEWTATAVGQHRQPVRVECEMSTRRLHLRLLENTLLRLPSTSDANGGLIHA
jgi:hypothetical protein